MSRLGPLGQAAGPDRALGGHVPAGAGQAWTGDSEAAALGTGTDRSRGDGGGQGRGAQIPSQAGTGPWGRREGLRPGGKSALESPGARVPAPGSQGRARTCWEEAPGQVGEAAWGRVLPLETPTHRVPANPRVLPACRKRGCSASEPLCGGGGSLARLEVFAPCEEPQVPR